MNIDNTCDIDIYIQGGGELEAVKQLENMDLIPNAEEFEVSKIYCNLKFWL